jgi:hypothetical protein
MAKARQKLSKGGYLSMNTLAWQPSAAALQSVNPLGCFGRRLPVLCGSKTMQATIKVARMKLARADWRSRGHGMAALMRSRQSHSGSSSSP